MGNKDIENFKASLKWALRNCSLLYEVAEEQHLLDEQYFIDWLDAINELSVRH